MFQRRALLAVVILGGVVLAVSRHALAQDCRVWREKRAFPFGTPDLNHIDMAYDRVREQFVLFGRFGGRMEPETWLSDGGLWWLASRSGPVPSYPRIACDELRGEMVLVNAGETWVWDGASWIYRAGNGPAARFGHGLAFDVRRGMTVMFGGRTDTCMGDTWEWDGEAWNARQVVGPEPRHGHAMAYDRVRQVTVLYGGQTPGSGDYRYLDDTWLWDGGAWTPAGVGGPRRCSYSAFAFDEARGECVLMGGGQFYMDYYDFIYDDVWRWDGAAWSQAASGPDARYGARMDYDAACGVMRLFGGMSGLTGPKVDVWEWSGAAWQATQGLRPEPSSGHVMWYDTVRNQTMLATGLTGQNWVHPWFRDRTWTYDHGRWSAYDRTPTGPLNLENAAAAFDERHAAAVLFGGEGESLYPSDQTWLWDGTVWQSPAVGGPPARERQAMAYDRARGVVLMFGGRGRLDYDGLGDTWQWDGAAWTQRSDTGPAPRVGAAMAYDAVRQVAVLFGGKNSTAYFADTWEWDGAAWNLRAAAGPPARLGHAMTYDERTNRTVLFGGLANRNGSVHPMEDTWEWDGDSWKPTLRRGPSPRGTQMVYAAQPGTILLFGGGGMNDLWTYGTTAGHGDANCDGTINTFDIEAFLLAVTSPSQWEARYACGFLCANDVNRDGSVNPADIDPFVELLSH